jgi:hypothetical protein
VDRELKKNVPSEDGSTLGVTQDERATNLRDEPQMVQKRRLSCLISRAHFLKNVRRYLEYAMNYEQRCFEGWPKWSHHSKMAAGLAMFCIKEAEIEEDELKNNEECVSAVERCNKLQAKLTSLVEGSAFLSAVFHKCLSRYSERRQYNRLSDQTKAQLAMFAERLRQSKDRPMQIGR